MTDPAGLAPGVPADYYRRIYDAEQSHWWYLGMRSIASALLADRLTRPDKRVLDAGCGTGGALRWLLDLGGVRTAAGIDIGSAAIALARGRVPEADLRVGELRDLPFDDRSFDLVLSLDVLQHVREEDVTPTLLELHRVLAPGGALLLRTNGARRLRRERADWRAYDRATLVAELVRAGFECERVTYANTALALAANLRRRAPRAPTEARHGIPAELPSALRTAVGTVVLGAEARWLGGGRSRTLPYGHTLFALARTGRSAA